MLKDYFEVRDWLEKFIPQTYTRRELGLERIKYLLKLLDNPEKKFKSIHVGGTSGKGSTAFYLARALQVGNFQGTTLRRAQSRTLKIGLHISPHLTYIGERMQIFSPTRHPEFISGSKKILNQVQNDKEEGSAIPVGRLVGLINKIKPVVEAIKSEQPHLTPSYFEILVASTFLYFANEKVDIAVVEVGLGGRLDATNVLDPELSIITNVGLDHTDILGDSIEKIAKEKAGIIKKSKVKGQRSKVITGASDKALEVIKKVAKEKKALMITESTLKTDDREYYDLLRNIKDQIDLELGKKVYITNECFFLVNLALNHIGIRLSKNEQRQVFSARFAARFEEIDDGVLVDGAHNRDKAGALINWVKKVQRLTTKDKRLKPVILVCAFKKGKDWKGILRLLLAELDIDRIYATQFYSVTDTGLFSSVDPEEIKDFLVSSVKTFNNSQEAVFEAVNNSVIASKATQSIRKIASDSSNPRNDKLLVLITGSLYLAGEARTIWELPPF